MSTDFSMPSYPEPGSQVGSPDPSAAGSQRTPSPPIATIVIIAICVAVFILQTLAGGSKNPDVLLDFGASYRPYFVHGQYWRAIMPMFLHIGLLHLGVNMYVLYVLGPLLERIYGYGRYAFIYVAAGVGGSLLTMFHGYNVSAGASGAIMGVAGALAAVSFFHRDRLPHPMVRIFRRGRFTMTILIFVAITLVSGYLVANIDNWGHIGGLMSGAILGALMPAPLPVTSSGPIESNTGSRPSQAIVWVPVAVVALGMAATAQHYRTGQQVSTLLQEALRLQVAHQSEAAMDRYKRAEHLDPQDERAHEALGELYLGSHRPADALEEFKRALSISPDSLPAQAGLAEAYEQSGDHSRAQEIYESLLRQHPRNPAAHEAAADFFVSRKLYQPALEQYREALRLSPDDALAHNNLAWMCATAEDLKYRDPAAALEHAEIAVRLTASRDPNVLDTLAEALFVNGKFSEAVLVEGQALRLAPDNTDFQAHMKGYQKPLN